MNINIEEDPCILESIYRDNEEHNDYKNNILINALPKFTDVNSILSTFGNYPLFSKAERTLNKAARMLAVTKLNNYIEPLLNHDEIIETISLMVREGYLDRNPEDKNYIKRLTKLYRQVMNGDIKPLYKSKSTSAPVYTLLGVSGVGKSTVVERTLSYLPQVLLHRKHGIIQIVWLKLECPVNGSLKQFILSFIIEVDRLLGSEYLKMYDDASTDLLINAMVKITLRHYLGILVIDEIQNLLDAKIPDQPSMTNFFVALCNSAKVPILLVGTPRALKLFGPDFRRVRRLGSRGAKIWNTLSEGPEWDLFLNGLWPYQWTCFHCKINPILSTLMYKRTQGIHALVVRLFQLAQLYAIRTGQDKSKEIITEDIINKVADENFVLVAPMLEALKSGKQNEIDKYDDLLKKTITEVKKNVDTSSKLENLEEIKKKKMATQMHAHRDMAMTAVTSLGYEPIMAADILNDIFNNQPDLTSSEALKCFLDATLAGELPKTGRPKGPKLKDITSVGGNPIEELERAGLIYNP